ncbi:hypothetical protein EVAR_22148_1 [Eumeta japonica]|uniref:Uncharacterized protein n=1 Tax=Eumeta variegata TaxID=151549 RepID=A0A4C1W257_EUMVA|nr:hypothetical protein EVAR_22148_1 [Eumeta japonica]
MRKQSPEHKNALMIPLSGASTVKSGVFEPSGETLYVAGAPRGAAGRGRAITGNGACIQSNHFKLQKNVP